VETQGQSKVLSGSVWGNTPDTKIVTTWSQFSCLGQGDVGEMDGRGWRDTPDTKNATLGSRLHVWGVGNIPDMKNATMWSHSSCLDGRG